MLPIPMGSPIPTEVIEPQLHMGEDGLLRYTCGNKDSFTTGTVLRGKQATLVIDGVEHSVMLTNVSELPNALPTCGRWLNSSILVIDDMTIGSKPYPGLD